MDIDSKSIESMFFDEFTLLVEEWVSMMNYTPTIPKPPETRPLTTPAELSAWQKITEIYSIRRDQYIKNQADRAHRFTEIEHQIKQLILGMVSPSEELYKEKKFPPVVAAGHVVYLYMDGQDYNLDIREYVTP